VSEEGRKVPSCDGWNPSDARAKAEKVCIVAG
jgi:hypothetical protein